MRTFKGKVSTGLVGSEMEFEFEVEDDATEQEINDEGWQAACELINTEWEEVKDE